jgi:hypothetical protein
LFALNLSDQPIGKIAFQMAANLSEIFSILDCDEQQQAWLAGVFRTKAPASGNANE